MGVMTEREKERIAEILRGERTVPKQEDWLTERAKDNGRREREAEIGPIGLLLRTSLDKAGALDFEALLFKVWRENMSLAITHLPERRPIYGVFDEGIVRSELDRLTELGYLKLDGGKYAKGEK